MDLQATQSRGQVSLQIQRRMSVTITAYPKTGISVQIHNRHCQPAMKWKCNWSFGQHISRIRSRWYTHLRNSAVHCDSESVKFSWWRMKSLILQYSGPGSYSFRSATLIIFIKYIIFIQFLPVMIPVGHRLPVCRNGRRIVTQIRMNIRTPDPKDPTLDLSPSSGDILSISFILINT